MRIKVNDTRIQYELSGGKDKPLLMMSHSLGSSLRMWDYQMEILEPHFRVLRYDLRGHGGSEAKPGPYTLELLSEDAVTLLDELKIEAVHWLGISIGGMIGQCMALNHGHRLRSLVLSDTTSRMPPESQSIWQERIDKVRAEGVQALIESTMQRWFTPSFLQKNPPELAVIKKEFLATTLEGYIGCSEAIRKLDYIDRLGEIKLPTLIIVGEDDLGAPVAASKAIHERIPNSKLIVIPSTCHFPNVERPSVFNAALIEFFESRSDDL